MDLFAIAKVDLKRASITVKGNMTNKWGVHTLTVWVSTYFKKIFLDKSVP